MSQILYINIVVDWSLSGIMTLKLVIPVFESTSSSVIIPYIFQNTVTCFIVFILRESSWGASGVNPSPGPLFLVNYHYEYMVKNMLLQQPLCVRHSYSGSAIVINISSSGCLRVGAKIYILYLLWLFELKQSADPLFAGKSSGVSRLQHTYRQTTVNSTKRLINILIFKQKV